MFLLKGICMILEDYREKGMILEPHFVREKTCEDQEMIKNSEDLQEMTLGGLQEMTEVSQEIEVILEVHQERIVITEVIEVVVVTEIFVAP